MFDLYLITDGLLADLPEAVDRALRRAPEGRVAVQLRAKQRGPRELLALAQALRSITEQRGASLFINDRIDIACSARADGVHLPEQGLPVVSARALLGSTGRIGVSCHDADGLQRAQCEGADFATLSPVFESPGKGTPLGCERFALWTRQAGLPVYALGGIRPKHVAQLRASGAAGVAVISGVFGARDPAAALEDYLRAWQDAAQAAGCPD